MSDREIIITTARDLCLKLMDDENLKKSLSFGTRESDLPANLEKVDKFIQGVFQAVSKAVAALTN